MSTNELRFEKATLPEKLSLKLFEKDVVIKFQKPKTKNEVKRNSVRGKIDYFSYRSKRRLKLFARNTSHLWKVFIHLTYPKDFPFDGKRVKKHLDTFIKRLKRSYPDIEFMWVIEFQRRGAPHFHILTDREVDKEWLSQNWYEVVGSGDIKHLWAGTRVELVKSKNHAVAYVINYLNGNKNKLYQKIVPEEYKNVGRFWSHSKNALKTAEYIITDTPQNNRRNTRTLRRWYKAKLRSWGYPHWKWKGEGFTAWEGASFFNELKKRGLPNDLTQYF